MTTNSLTEIEYGSEAKSQILNDNFTYLDNRIGIEVSRITGDSDTTIASLDSRTATIERTISHGNLVPVGSVFWFAGGAVPTGYLLCDGRSYSRASYPSLSSVLGSYYGGDANNFNVPNLIGRIAQGGSPAPNTVVGSSAGGTDAQGWGLTHSHGFAYYHSAYPGGEEGRTTYESAPSFYHSHGAWAHIPSTTLLPCIKC